MSSRQDKTEKPTPKRRREARQKGNVSRSPELVAWSALLAAGVLLPVLVRNAGGRLLQLMALAMQVVAAPTPAGAVRVLGTGLSDMVFIVVPTAVGFMVLGVVLTAAQVGLHISPKALAPQMSRLNPRQGLKRLTSGQGLWEGGKSAIKLALIAGVAFRSFTSLVNTLVAAPGVDLGGTVTATGHAILSLMRSVGMAGLALAAGDYAIQRRHWMTGLMMTKQEVKDEMRQSEGDPMNKGRIRNAQRRLSRMRMMAEVARADVVAVNPTHYAVAIRYDRSRSSAPRVVAKGTDHLALRIREIAMTNGVPVVEDPPLARALHGACEIDSEIPYHLYLAVARLLAFVYNLSPLSKGGLVRHLTPSAMLA
ncbi:MAG TPA: EscU/YscU/HrcU family type III secretion system export apparatus switch protein [Acidimicrobiales bacterium]|nr:EscU/YscU/HrcU family type III secretion system export apparatus switch protein [Acidimicrobiales bacterium]